MKYLLYITIFNLVFTSCHSNKKQEVKIHLPIEKEISISNLKESFINKDETQFLNQFPKNFDQFNNCFGWDSVNSEPQKLYDKANDYIDYWFELLNNDNNKEYEKNIIKICINGHWEADAINYFQDKALKYIKEKKKYHLINELTDDEVKSVLFFLFDSPHPQFDEDFAFNLTPEKKKILDDLFVIGLFDGNENPDPDASISYNISDFENIEHYFIKDIDINNDSVPDKVVSADRYQGDELFLFINKGDEYKFVLKTTNFSEDGGNQIKNIKKTENGFVVVTAFPDRGFFESHYYITFKDDHWILTNTIYKTSVHNQDNSSIYVCDVKQGIDISDSDLLSNLKSIPDESNRDKTCLKEKMSFNQTETTSNDDISGEYELIKGYTLFIGSDDDEMLSANIIIEKLSETDYGFYSAYKVKEISPIGDFGVLTKHKNSFHNLAICDENSVEGYSKDNFTNGIYLHNQVIIQKKGDTLAMIRYGGNFRRYMLYKKKKAETNFSIYLVKTLKSSKVEYEDFLIKYKQAKNYDRSKLEIEHTLINDSWTTKHKHKQDSENNEVTHYYQNAYQDGEFVKQDSIFLKQLNE